LGLPGVSKQLYPCRQPSEAPFRFLPWEVHTVCSPLSVFNFRSPISTLSPQAEEVLKNWDKLSGLPTWKNGKDALQVWLNGTYPPIKASFKLSSIFQEVVRPADVFSDLSHATDRKFRLWDSVDNCSAPTASPDDFKNRLIDPGIPSHCMTAFGIQASPNGVLKGKPVIPKVRDLENKPVQTVGDRCWPKPYHIPTSDRKRLPRQKRMTNRDVRKPQHLWELVVSEAGGITGFHIDSHGTGGLISQLVGTKVICSCPPTAHNWAIFKDYYLKIPPQDQYFLPSHSISRAGWAN